ncbi:hypothetical protein EVAR_89099_1 [Eumeta japonica]|uniref:Uncharacterized protein n=1 Tax=Eumeta variegata TaxID=151549 RepID=A0A4C1XHF5_EUMVA|nr:hypothetical protein EVAR_89099_1 [Eumeta japonica]
MQTVTSIKVSEVLKLSINALPATSPDVQSFSAWCVKETRATVRNYESVDDVLFLDFYQKFVETDALIKDLKRRINGYHTDSGNTVTIGAKDSMYRYKRSMKRPSRPKYYGYLHARNVDRVNNDVFVNNVDNNKKFERNLQIKSSDPKSISTKRRLRNVQKINGKPMRFIIERENYVVSFDNIKRDGQKLKMTCNCSHTPESGNKREKHLKQHFLKNEQSLKHVLSRIPDAVNMQYPVGSKSLSGRREDLSMELPQNFDRSFRLAFLGNKKKDFEPKLLNGTEDSFTLKVGNKSLVFDDKEYMKDLMNEENLSDIEEKLKNAKAKAKHKARAEDIPDEVSTILHPNENNKQNSQTQLRPNIRRLLEVKEMSENELTASELPMGNIYADYKGVQDLQDALQLKVNLNFAGSEELNRIIKNAVLRNVYIGFRDALPEGVEVARMDRDLSEVEKLEEEMKEKMLVNELNPDTKPMKSEPDLPDAMKTNTRKLMQVNEDAAMEGTRMEVVSESTPGFTEGYESTPSKESIASLGPSTVFTIIVVTIFGDNSFNRFLDVINHRNELNTHSDSMKIDSILYPSASKPEELVYVFQNAAIKNPYASLDEMRSPKDDDFYVLEEDMNDMENMENPEAMTTDGFVVEISKKTSQIKKIGDSTKPVQIYSRRLLQHTTEQENDLDNPEEDGVGDNANAVNFYSKRREEIRDDTKLADEKFEDSEIDRADDREGKNIYFSSEPLTEITAATAPSVSPKSVETRLRRLLQDAEQEKGRGSGTRTQLGKIIHTEGEVKLPYGSVKAKEMGEPPLDKEFKFGMMPLAAEEIARMINNAALRHWYQSTHGSATESKRIGKMADDQSDFDYMEDLSDIQERLIKVSQAYSDYGVLEEKRGDVLEQSHDEGKSLANLPLKERQELSRTQTVNQDNILKGPSALSKLINLKRSELSDQKQISEKTQALDQPQSVQMSQPYTRPRMKLFSKHGRKKKMLLKYFPVIKLEVQPDANAPKSSFKKTLEKFIKFIPNEEVMTEAEFKDFTKEKTTDVPLFNLSPDFAMGDNVNAFQIIDKDTIDKDTTDKDAIDKTTKHTFVDVPKIDIDIRLPTPNRKGRSLLSMTKTAVHLNQKADASRYYDNELRMNTPNATPNGAVNVNQTIANENHLDSKLPKVFLFKTRSLFSLTHSDDKLNTTKYTAAAIVTNSTVTENDTSSHPLNQIIEKRNNNTADSNLTVNPGNVTSVVTHNKTIVKRDAFADENNMILWNDFYDDEHGVDAPKQDSLFEENDAKKGDNWLSRKIYNIKRHRHGRNKSQTYPKTNVDHVKGPTITKQIISKQRSASQGEHIEPNDRKESLERLSANMENVFKQAADAVNEMRAPEVTVREEKDVQNEETSSMMQQLVTLMGDLVNYQVQQKTCVKLPPDLRDFLVWLTRPIPSTQKNGFITLQIEEHENPVQEAQPSERPSKPISRPNSEKENTDDPRSDCLGTLRAVQDLLHEYDSLSQSDKNKLTGVKEYLEVQLDYLQRQLTGFHGSFAKARRLKKNEKPPKHRITNISNQKIGRDLSDIISNPIENQRKSSKSFNEDLEDIRADAEELQIESGRGGVESQKDVYDFSRRRRNSAKTKRKYNNSYRKLGKSSDDLDSKLVRRHDRRTKEVIEVTPETKEVTRVDANATQPKVDMEKEMIEKEAKREDDKLPYTF